MKRFTTAAAVAFIAAASLLPRPAAADPIAAKKAEAARIAAQLDDLARNAEVLTEQYDAAQLKVSAADADAVKAAAALRTADAAVAAAQIALKQTAVDAYVHGGLVPLGGDLATPKNALDLTIRRKYLNVVADRQTDALRTLRTARDDAARRRADLDRATQTSHQALLAADAKRKAAAGAVGAQQALLSKTKGDLAALVTAEQQRKAAEDAKRVQLALAAQKAAQSSPTTSPSAKPSGTTPTLLNRSTGTAPSNPPPPPNSGAAAAVAEAKRQLGKPYEWAAAGPDTFDCSGLTMWAWSHAGKQLPHNAAAQYNATARVAIADLQPGDLVFFGSDLHHVGIYVGSGQMIDAPQTGEVVRYDSIYRSDLVQSGGRVY